MEIRNIAIIAHVDHGKTKITDALMHQTGMTAAGVSMDSDALEQERGITIYSKNTSVLYKGTKINIVDTPGHADFGSEVERVLRSIDSVVLVVDAQEGPMPQTKFVLKKSLELGLVPIVVINKIDKPAARIGEVEELVFELFFDLGASDEQLDFVTLYSNAKAGFAMRDLEEESADLTPLLDTILERVRPASSAEDKARPFRIQPFNLAYDNYIGRLAICRVYEGTIHQADSVFVKSPEGETRTGRIGKLFTFRGLEREEVREAHAGDIIMVSGLPDIYIGETVCASEEAEALPAISVDEPTISLRFLVNNSPFAGREGRFVTNRQLKERLEKELEVNVGLRIDFDSADHYKVYGRGELHIAILLENMRREGYELQVSQPNVLFKEENGRRTEPFEELTIQVPEEMAGMMIEKMAARKGALREINTENGETRLIFEIPVRGLLGYRNDFLTDTRGEGIMCTRAIGFRPYAGEIERSRFGSMVSMSTGKALGYSLDNLQKRGTLYIGANTDVYEGQVIGNTSKGRDMTVNPIKGKHLTNMRASGADDAIRLTPPLEITLERGLGIMNDDEYLEVTPKSVRLRKVFLKESEREKAFSRNMV